MAPLVCPDCGEEIIFTACGLSPDLSAESASALAALVVATHRRMVHPREEDERARSDDCN